MDAVEDVEWGIKHDDGFVARYRYRDDALSALTGHEDRVLVRRATGPWVEAQEPCE